MNRLKYEYIVNFIIKSTLDDYTITSWDARLCLGFGTMYGNIMVKNF